MIISELIVGHRYTNDDIFKSLKVGNAGGIRLSIQDKAVMRVAIMASVQDFHVASENPYQDRLESGILTYTAAGKIGEQTLAGVNRRVIEQKQFTFPIHGFISVASRRDKSVGPKHWQYLGLLEYRRYYPDTQLDSHGKIRKVWIFEFEIHQEPQIVPLALDAIISREALGKSGGVISNSDDDSIVNTGDSQEPADIEEIERVRSRLMAMEPRRFEFFVKDLLIHCGFRDVCVTKISADGGVDVNAKAGVRMWIFENTLIQVQAKRWLHSVGRKEVAELRGSLQPFAKGAVVTTSHFSKAAINEAGEEGKHPITLVDGFKLSKLILDEQFTLS
jgi:HJR/Mrr/RecB family endonuclease